MRPNLQKPPKAQIKACRLVSQALKFIRLRVRPGLTERKLARQINAYLFSHGAAKLAFPTIVAAGKSSASPHHWPTKKLIQNNDLVLIDIGAVIDGWRSDITRTFFVGKPKPAWIKTYRQVLTAQEKALSALHRESILGRELDAVSRSYFKKLKLDKHFIHGLGHGIGRWIPQSPHLSPKAKHQLVKPGDVITIEPGLYFKNRFGIRIEDTVVKTKSGYKYLTHFPKDLKSVTIWE